MDIISLMNVFVNEGVKVKYVGEKIFHAPTLELTLGSLEVTAIVHENSVHYMAYNDHEPIALPQRALKMDTHPIGEHSTATNNPTVAVTIARWMRHYNK